MSDSSELLKKALLLRARKLNSVFEKHSPKEWLKGSGCVLRVCTGFSKGKVKPCHKKHLHLYVFYYMNWYQRLASAWAMFLGKKISMIVYHFDPDWQSNREYMYQISAVGMHQPEVAIWMFEASLHPTYAAFLQKAMKGIIK